MIRYNIYALLGLAVCTALIVLLHDKRVGEILLKSAAGLLLLYKTAYYAHKNLTVTFCAPVEFSAQSYFLVPALFLCGKKGGKAVAGFLGLLCGAGFFIGYSLAGFYLAQKLPADAFFTAVVCHGILLLIGVYSCRRISFEKKDRGALATALLLMAAWALIFYPTAGQPTNLFVWVLLKPPFLFPATTLWHILGALGYYAALIGAFYVLTSLFFYIAAKLNRLWKAPKSALAEREAA